MANATKRSKVVEIAFAAIIGGGQLWLGLLSYRILRTQNRILEGQTKLSETQAVVSIIAALELKPRAGNELKLAQLSKFPKEGHKTLLTFAESARTDPRIRAGAFHALFGQWYSHDAVEARGILWAFCRDIDPYFRWDTPPLPIAFRPTGKTLDAYLPLAGEFGVYLDGITARMKGDQRFREAVRKDISTHPDFVGGLAVLHEAFLREDKRLEREFRRAHPRVHDFPTHVGWHTAVFDFARGMNGAFSYDTFRYTPGRWKLLPDTVKGDIFERQRILRQEIAGWFQVRPSRSSVTPATPAPSPLGEPKRAPTATPAKATPRPFFPSPHALPPLIETIRPRAV